MVTTKVWEREKRELFHFISNDFSSNVIFYHMQLYIQIQGSPQPTNNNKKIDFIAYGTNQYNYA